MNDRNYWRRRAEQLEQEWQGRCRSEVEKELAAHYRAALKEIADDIAALFGRFSRDNSLGYLEARRLIRGAEFKAWRMSLEEYVAAAAADSAILKELNTLAMRSRISRLEKLYSETLVELQKLGERSEAAIGDFLKTAGRERYLQGLYDLGAVGKLAIPVSKLNPANLEKTLAARWEGGNYSTRIWKNTTKLAKTLKATISQGLHRGLSIDKMSKAIDRDMRAGYKNAERLVRTEMNFVQTRMAADSMSAAGLDEYEFVAVLDHRTTQRCQALDGTTHLIEEMQQGANAPPMHPRCRSTITATFSETLKGGTRTARVGGKSIHVPRDMSYADFKAVYVDKTTTLKDWQATRDRSGITLKNSTSSGKIFLHESSSSGTIGKESGAVSSDRLMTVGEIKDIKEADEFATKVLGVPNASYSGCAVSVAQKWNKRLQEVFQDFPELKRQIKFVGEVHERNKAIQEKLTQVFVDSFSENHPDLSMRDIENMAKPKIELVMKKLAVSSGSYAKSLSTDIIIVRDFNGVTINADHAKNPFKLKADLNDAVRRGWHPRGCDTIESLVDHEIGHQLNAMLGLSELKTIRGLYDSLITIVDGKPDYAKITEGLSEYAWNNDNPDRYSEFIAEAWAEYRNNRNAREIARKVGKIIEEEYRKKFHGSGESK